MAETQADILRHAAGFYPIQVAVADAMMAGADALEEVTRLRVETAKLRSHLFRADPHHEQAVQQALDQTTPQEVER